MPCFLPVRTCIQKVNTWQFLTWPFLGWWKRDPVKGCWWPPTIGDKKVTAWITWYAHFACIPLVALTFSKGEIFFAFSCLQVDLPSMNIVPRRLVPVVGLWRRSFMQQNQGTPRFYFSCLFTYLAAFFLKQISHIYTYKYFLYIYTINQ